MNTDQRIIFHLGIVVAAWHLKDDLDAGIQLYQLEHWPYLLKRCGCQDAPEPPAVYEPLTPEQVHLWLEKHR
jgi:hypothetical protein